MRYCNLAIIVISLYLIITPSFAKTGGGDEGGGGGGNETTSTVGSGYNSNRSTDGINANLGYSNNLAKNLLFEFDVGLNNSYNTSEKREIQNHSVRLSNKYDPPSPWKLDVSYNYNRSYNYRPKDVNQDEYKAFNKEHNLSSSVSYAFTETVRTYLDVNLNKVLKESIVAGQSNPDTRGEKKSINSSIEYDITPNTTTSFRYTGGIDSTEYSGSSERIADPLPPPKKGRTENHTIYGVITSNNALTENIDIDISLNVTDQFKRDRLLPGLDSDKLTGSAGSTVKYDPSTKFDFTNNTTLSRGVIEYFNKADYQNEFSGNIYDTDDTRLYNSAAVTIKPSGGSSADFTYDITFSKQYRFKDGKVMPRHDEDPTAANSIYEDVEHRLVSGVNTAIGEDLTFHLTHYYSSSHPDYLQNPSKNALTNLNNLDSNLGYDITEKLRTDVKTILNFKNVRYDDRTASVDDAKESSISLSNEFTFKPSLITKLTLGFLVKKDFNDYTNNSDRSYENIDRHIISRISQDIGKLFDLSFNFTYKYNYTNFLASAQSNIRQNTITANPSAIINISESLFSSLRFTYSNVTQWKPYGDENDSINSWWRTHNYTTNFNVTYTPLDKFTVNFSLGSGHNFRLENEIYKVKKNEDNDYYNVSLDMNYEW